MPANKWTPDEARSWQAKATAAAKAAREIRRTTRKEIGEILARDPQGAESALRRVCERLVSMLSHSLGTERGERQARTLKDATQALRTLLAANREAADLAAIQARLPSAPASAYLAASLDPPKNHP